MKNKNHHQIKKENMKREQRHEKLIELIQDAVTDYVYETNDEDFAALIEVNVGSGWTTKPVIKSYECYTDEDEQD